jgi:hypothetical protein
VSLKKPREDRCSACSKKGVDLEPISDLRGFPLGVYCKDDARALRLMKKSGKRIFNLARRFRHNEYCAKKWGKYKTAGEIKAEAKEAAARKAAHEKDLALLVEGVRQILRRTAEREKMEELLRDNPYAKEEATEGQKAEVEVRLPWASAEVRP